MCGNRGRGAERVSEVAIAFVAGRSDETALLIAVVGSSGQTGMSKQELKSGVHCMEIVSGKGISGTFTANEEGNRVKLFSFGDFIYFPPEDPLYLVTAEGGVISMFRNISKSLGNQSSIFSELAAIHHQEIISNLCLSGVERWHLDDKVKRVRFTVPHIINIMRNEDKIGFLSLERHDATSENYDIFRIKSKNLCVSASYTADYSLWSKEPQNIDVVFEVEYDEAQDLGRHLVTIQDISNFFVFATGLPLTPSSVVVSRLSSRDFMARLEKEHVPDEHRDLVRFRSYDVEDHGIHFHGSPVHADDVGELSALALSLLAWMDRAETWRGSYAHMFDCSRQRQMISAERILSACRWLEELPSAQPIRGYSDGFVGSIISSAIEAAKNNGHEELTDRIASSLKKLTSESHRSRFARLSQIVDFDFQLKSKEQFLNDLSRSQRLRGKAAHGRLDFESEEDFLNCARSVSAVEALCYLLTAKDLPISDLGRELSRGNRFVSDYAQSR